MALVILLRSGPLVVSAPTGRSSSLWSLSNRSSAAASTYAYSLLGGPGFSSLFLWNSRKRAIKFFRLRAGYYILSGSYPYYVTWYSSRPERVMRELSTSDTVYSGSLSTLSAGSGGSSYPNKGLPVHFRNRSGLNISWTF